MAKIRYKICFLGICLLLIQGCKSNESLADLPEDQSLVDLKQINIQSPWSDYQATASKDFAIRHVSLDLKIDLEERSVHGVAELILSPFFYDQEVLILDAYKFQLNQVSINDQKWELFEYDSSQLYIELPKVFAAGEQLICKVNYTLTDFSIPAQAAGRNAGGIFLVDYWEGRSPQLWTQGQTNYTSHWYPTIDQPNQRYTQTVRLTVRDSLSSLSNGVLRAQERDSSGWRTDTWVLNKPHPPYLSMIAVGSFDKKDLNLGGIPGSIWYGEGDIHSVTQAFSRTSQMIAFFESKFKTDFQWPAYHQIIVKDYISGAMENTGAVVFLEDAALTEQEQQYLHYDDYISHELAHHWFGNLVTCESWANLALNESLATYSEQLWNEHYYGQDSADLLARRELDQYLQESVQKKEHLIRYYYENADAELFDGHSYAKGARILHMLRRFIGDDAFFEGLAKYLGDNKFKTVEASDLRKAFEEVTGQDLNWFFQQWFLNPGHPVVNVSHEIIQDTLYLSVEQTQDLTLYPLYYLPLYVDVYWGQETLTYPLSVANQIHTFRIPAQGRSLKAIQFDSDFQMVGEVIHSRSTEELSYQAINAEDIVSRVAAYEAIVDQGESVEMDSVLIDRILSEENELVLVEWLDRLYRLETVDWAEHLERLQYLASHSHPQIRAAALLLLDKIPDKIEWTQIYLSDASNYVKGLALESLLGIHSFESNMLLLDSIKTQTDLNLILPLTLFINRSLKSGYGEWYQEKIKSLRSADQLYLLSAYSDYLLDAPQLEKLSARDFLKHYAKYHVDTDSRLIALQGLLLLSGSVSIDQQVKEVLSFETNDQLLALYLDFYRE